MVSSGAGGVSPGSKCGWAADQVSLKSRFAYPLTSLWQSTLALRYADHIFCLNSEDQDYLVNRLHPPRNSITRVFPVPDSGYASAAAERNYAESCRLLFAGTWTERKGIRDLVQCIHRDRYDIRNRL